MGTMLTMQQADDLLQRLAHHNDVFAPCCYPGEGCFSGTDIVRYSKVEHVSDIVFDRKSDYSFKEALSPANETMFYFTENAVTIPDLSEKGTIIFLRSCDLNAVERQDQIYLKNGFGDFYFDRRRQNTHFILMGCSESFENCFCTSMGSNTCSNYVAYVLADENGIYIDTEWEPISTLLKDGTQESRSIAFVQENKTKVQIPENLSPKVADAEMWDDYGARCIGCGRCNFVCPTCTCYTMQDIFYQDNPKVGERRRVWASCQVDGYSDIAGSISFRKQQGERMRYKVLHKVLDFKQKFGYQMCVGCGRCTDVCPEYISLSDCINKLGKAMKEVSENA